MNTVVVKNDILLTRERVVKPILAEIIDLGYSSKDQFAIRLGLEEAISNAYKHGNKCDPDKTICVRWRVESDQTVICVADSGEGFDPESVPDPRENGNVAKPTGRGLLLIKSYMTDVQFNDKSNELWMMKKREDVRSQKSDVRSKE